MLFSLLYADYPINIKIGLLVLHLFCVVLALSMHEFAHGYAAYKMGDDTAKRQGRLTLNPLAHIDPVGFLMMLVMGFGWAKPVPVNVSNMKSRRKGLALTSVAGPLMNLMIALVSGLGVSLLWQFDYLPALYIGSFEPLSVLSYTLYLLATLNIGLALFNLIPLPPLDGSNILLSFLKPNVASKYMKVRYYTQYIFLGVLLVSVLADYSTLFAYLDYYIWLPFEWARSTVLELILKLGDWMFGWI